MKNQKYKIAVVIIIALFFVTLLAKTIFVQNTPRLNKQFFENLFQKNTPLTPTPSITYFIIPTVPPKSPPQLSPTRPPQKISPTKTIRPTTTLSSPIPSKYISSSPTNSPTKRPTNSPSPLPSSSHLSSSKIGIFILSDYSEGAKSIVASGPRVIKVMDPQSIGSIANAMKEYKSKYPSGIVLARFYFEAPGNSLDSNPVDAAENIFNVYIKPQINKLGDSLRYVDYIETPNESDQTQTWDTITKTQWNAQFWMRLADLYHQAGTKICAGSIAVANIGNNSYDGVGQYIAELVPMLREIKHLGGAWCYHGYSLNFTTDLNEEIWTSLRYRVFYDYLQKNAIDVADIPMIISETGIDQTGDPKTSGWQARGSQQQFENWLTWYDGQIKQDSYIIGATIFQSGDGHWSSFNLDPIAGWLSNYLKQ